MLDLNKSGLRFLMWGFPALLSSGGEARRGLEVGDPALSFFACRDLEVLATGVVSLGGGL